MVASAGGFVKAALFMAVLLRFGGAIRVRKASRWWEKYCIQFKIKDNCEQAAMAKQAECTAHFEAMDAAGQGSVAYGKLRFDPKTWQCSNFFAAKEDIIYKEENPPADTIRRAVQACEPMAKEVCRTATCPTYCSLQGREDCDCGQICEATSKKMWGTGSIDCAPPRRWSECINEHHAKLTEDKRIAELEAISREHILKCVCVSHQQDDSVCYQGSQGIAPGQKWCEFNRNPSWRHLLESKKPSDWQSDWSAGHEPNCSLKELDLEA
jgi:hypothetical protein